MSGESRHPLTRPQIWVPLAALLFVLNLPFLHLLTRGEAEVTATLPFTDEFARFEVGEHYFSTGGAWQIEGEELFAPGVKNNPLWLKASLPRDVVVEFDARSESEDGDLKVEIFGNGRDHASGYVLIFGGWKNTVSAIARLDEHGRDRLDRRDRKVQRGKTYRFRIERRGSLLSWFVDDELFLELDDPAPLHGKGHDRFGFGGWQADLYFDNLSIRPAG